MLFEELPPDEGVSKKPQLRSRWIGRWSDEALERKRSSLPAREWELHWKIDLSSLDEDDRPLKLRAFITVRWSPDKTAFPRIEIGRASCRERVCQYGSILGVSGT